MDIADLLDTFREAERLLEQADEIADAGDHARACRTYSRAAGMVLDALDAEMADRGALA